MVDTVVQTAAPAAPTNQTLIAKIDALIAKLETAAATEEAKVKTVLTHYGMAAAGLIVGAILGHVL